MNPYDYSIAVRRIEDENKEQYFEARVRELPDVVEYADTHQEAYELAIDSIETTAQALAEHGREMPPPAPIADDYSGRITVRTTRSLHRDLAILAEEENVSLNQLIVSVLGRYTGMKTARFSWSGLVHWQSPTEADNAASSSSNRHLRIVRDETAPSADKWSNAV